MMKTKSKFNGRFLSILLTLVMCLTLLPMTVFAEGGEPEEIDAVDITVANVPVVGGEPATNGITVNTEGLNFSFAQNYLVKDSKYYPIGSDRIYEAGKEYAIGVTMLLKENYKFAKDIIVNVNNNKAKMRL